MRRGVTRIFTRISPASSYQTISMVNSCRVYTLRRCILSSVRVYAKHKRICEKIFIRIPSRKIISFPRQREISQKFVIIQLLVARTFMMESYESVFHFRTIFFYNSNHQNVNILYVIFFLFKIKNHRKANFWNLICNKIGIKRKIKSKDILW